ncbi:MAG: hypothetical protein OSJ59_05475 [Lachnospiraceae bacterium]|nr:hypothetical protein [Lachnospiraceae bacterium]
MLHILLLILKIIGIVLLCILGVLLLCIACALFVPVRYRIEAVRKEGEGEPPVAVTVKVIWLLHFVNVLVRFAGELSVRVRLTVIPVFRFPKKGKRGRKAEAESPDSGQTGGRSGTESSAERADSENMTMVSERSSATETTKSQRDGEQSKIGREEEQMEAREETDVPGATNKRENENGETDAASEEKPDKKPTLWEKLRAIPEILRNIFVKIKSIFENIQYTIKNICDKIRSVLDTIEYYKGVIEGEPFKRSFALCKGELLAICKRLKPDRFEAALIVGMDDPAATGEILAVCGMLYPILGPKVNVVGEFERKRLEGRVFIKGKLRFFTFVRVAVRIYFNKDIRKLYGLLKKEAV